MCVRANVRLLNSTSGACCHEDVELDLVTRDLDTRGAEGTTWMIHPVVSRNLWDSGVDRRLYQNWKFRTEWTDLILVRNSVCSMKRGSSRRKRFRFPQTKELADPFSTSGGAKGHVWLVWSRDSNLASVEFKDEGGLSKIVQIWQTRFFVMFFQRCCAYPVWWGRWGQCVGL